MIRHATPADNRLLAEIGAETFRDTFAADNTPDDMARYLAESFSPERQAGELAEPDSLFLIAELGADVAGYARLKFRSMPDVSATGTGGAVELARLYVRSAWIGHGVGAALMTACQAVARERACTTMWLGVWERNQRALRFYEKSGFTAVGEQIFQLGNDAQRDLIMVRPIESAMQARDIP